MSEKSTFFNSVSGDRKYNAADMALHFSKVLTNGVMPSGTQLQATANSGMSIVVTAGSAWINGYAYHNDSDFTLAIDPADGVLNRIDRVVVRWGRLARSINLVVIKGIAASTPVAPALVRNVDSYDLCIATISVGNGITGITQAMITDTRMDSAVCGFVSSLIQPDTSGWFSQFDTAFNDAISENQSNWAAWFATVQDALDENTAGNLLNLINGKQDALTAGDVTKTMLSANATNTSVTVTLPVESWHSKQQSASVAGMTVSKVCIVSPAPESFTAYTAYGEAGVRATTQGDGTLTFTCEDTPSTDLIVNVTMLT